MAVIVPMARRHFIGRRAELEQLRAAYRQAAAGNGATVLVEGDAGIGKTRLVTELRTWLAEQSGLAGVGECLDYAQAPYAPFADALREILRAQPQALNNALLVRRFLSALLPEFAAANSQTAPPASKRQLFDAYAEALRLLSERAPLVIVIEDLHWGDPDTLDLLVHLAGIVPAMRVVICATYRQEETVRAGFSPALSRLLRRSATALTLAPLRAEEMSAFTREALGGKQPVDRRAVERAVALSEGNPLFAEELLRHALEGKTELSSLTLRALILERLRPLSDQQRLVLVYAAVIGRRFEATLLAATMGKPLDEVALALRLGRDNQLILEEAGEHVTYTFRHALVQEILYRELLAPELQAVHFKIARALEQAGDVQRHAIGLAHHYWSAKEVAKAAEYAELAGDTSMQALAFSEAATYYERAIEGTAPAARDRRSQLFEKLGSALLIAGLPERSIRSYTQALELLPSDADLQRRALLHSHISRAEYLVGDHPAASASVDRARKLLAGMPPNPVLFRLAVRWVFLKSLEANLDEVRAALLDLEAFPASPPLDLQPRFHVVMAIANMLLGDYARAEQACAAAIAAAEQLRDGEELFAAHNTAALVYDEIGEKVKAKVELNRAVEAAQEYLLVSELIIGRLNQIGNHLAFGEITNAREDLEGALAVPNLSDMPLLMMGVRAYGTVIALHQGDRKLLDELASDAWNQNVQIHVGYLWVITAAQVELSAHQGRLQEAQLAIHRGVANAPSARATFWPMLFAARFATLDDLVHMRAIIQPWVARQRLPRGQAFNATLDCYIAKAKGQQEESKRHADVARTGFAQEGSLILEALAAELGGHRRDAIELYRRAGAFGDVVRLDADGSRRRRDRHAIELSEREREVAKLVSQGKSNKAIASALIISERTVENHITSIFKKMGVSSRAELIARYLSSV